MFRPVQILTCGLLGACIPVVPQPAQPYHAPPPQQYAPDPYGGQGTADEYPPYAGEEYPPDGSGEGTAGEYPPDGSGEGTAEEYPSYGGGEGAAEEYPSYGGGEGAAEEYPSYGGGEGTAEGYPPDAGAAVASGSAPGMAQDSFDASPGGEPPGKKKAGSGLAPYWGTLLVVDLASVAVGLSGLEYGQELYWVGLGGVVLAPSVVHLAHGDRNAASVSAAARTILPVAGGLAGGLLGFMAFSFDTASSEEESGDDMEKGIIALAIVGAGAGVVGGMIISYITHTKSEPAAVAPGASAQTRAWVPTVSPTRGGASVGIMGNF